MDSDSEKNNPSCRLMNPAKPEIGKISKITLQRIISIVKSKTKANQWKNSSEVISWFKNLKDKNRLKFILWDIVEFYPSISAKLLNDALDYAAKFTTITRDERNIIIQSRKCFLYKDGSPWSKKSNSEFDITMGAYDGAECCEIVGLFMISELKPLKLDGGVYRDDCLAASSATPRQVEILKKDICSIFKRHNLRITIEANKKCVNFLDVTLNLADGLYRPYKKPNDVPCYVHKMSNHPPSVTKNIPAGVNKRLSAISANEEIFKEAAPTYQDALKSSGYNYQLEFNPINQHSSKNRCRSRKITWFNPPFSANVKTNVGAKFLRLIDQHFPKNNPLRKLINRNTTKVSYRCLPSMSRVIAMHNAKLLRNAKPQPQPQPNEAEPENCNCQKKDECPLDGQCQTRSLIYQSNVTKDDGKKENYIGLTANTFKERWDGHKSSFRHEDKASKTTLSQYIWKLKSEGAQFTIEWKVISKAAPFSPVTGLCNLCTAEKFYIIHNRHLASLNSRNELTNHCRHKIRQLLENT